MKHLAVADDHVRALGLAGHGIGAGAKGGMNKWYFRCVPPLPLRLTPSSARHRSSRTSQTLLCASADGYARTHDPRNALRRENGDSAVQDLQATGIFFFTIGSSSGSLSSSLALTSARRGHDFPDPLVKASSTSLTCPIPTPLACIAHVSHSPFVPSLLQPIFSATPPSTAVSSSGSYLHSVPLERFKGMACIL